MSDAHESLQRALREREAARERGDHDAVTMFDRAIDSLILTVDDDCETDRN